MAWRNGGTAFNDIITTLRMKVMIHSAEDKISPQYGICSESVTNLSFLYQSQIHSTRNQRIEKRWLLSLLPFMIYQWNVCLATWLLWTPHGQSTTKANKSVITLAKINIPDHEGKLYSYHPLETRKNYLECRAYLLFVFKFYNI